MAAETNLAGLQAALAAFQANLAKPASPYPALSNAGMYPSPETPYANFSDQLKDAFMLGHVTPGAPINPFGGNNVPRYDFAKGGVPPRSIGGYGWTMNMPGGGAAPGGGDPSTGRVGTTVGGGIMVPGGPPVKAPPLTGEPVPPRTREPGLFPGASGPGKSTPVTTAPVTTPPKQPALPVGVPFPDWAKNWETPPAANNTAANAMLARNSSAEAGGKLTAALGEQGANQMQNRYNVGGTDYKPWLNVLATNGWNEPPPAAWSQWASEGLGTVVNGKWQWAPGKGWE